jgi:eukaryotic-like serine/threonine-protein kinase
VADGASPLLGTVLGEAYRLTREIGRGGMGAVYEGVHLRLNRRVAIKLMARELSANAEALARFRREAEVTSQLGHPHIVQVFDFGEAPTGEPYLVMEFLEGEDLDGRIRRVGRLSTAATAHIIKQVASALSATHAKGIVHRDLKPANVFVLAVEGETDFVKVVDFGISKVKAATTRLTSAAAVMGTPNYMSPEQAAGRVDEIDSATDQWALACIAYELLAGRPPFVGDNVASLLYQVVHEAPSPLAKTTPGLPAELEDVLRVALSKKPTERFASVAAFSRAFESATTGTGAMLPTQLPAATPAPPSRPEIAATGLAAPRAATATGQAKAVTTFGAAAGEAISAEPGTPKRGRALALGVGALAVAGVAVAAIALSSSRGSSPSASPAAAAAPPSGPPPAAAPPATAPPTAAPAPPPRAPKEAAAPPEEHAAPPRARRRSTKGAAPAAATTAAAPAAPTAQARAAEDAPPSRPQPKAAADQPTWPPPAKEADAPTWPPPGQANENPTSGPPPKRKGFIRRIFGN